MLYFFTLNSTTENVSIIRHDGVVEGIQDDENDICDAGRSKQLVSINYGAIKTVLFQKLVIKKRARRPV